MTTNFDTTSADANEPGLVERQTHWDGRADQFDRTFTQAPVRTRVLDEISKLLPRERCTALDAGTGTGRAMARLIEGLHPESDIVGCDLSPEMLHQARQLSPRKAKGALSYVYADLTELPFDDNTFDLLVSTFTLHHVPPSQQQAALKEFRRVLRPDGTLIVADQIQPDPPLAVEEMRAAVADTFYPELPRDEAVQLLSTYGEWPLTATQMRQLLYQNGFQAQVTEIHRIVAVASTSHAE
ncbi:class I SAM-dependent methyltransferase [Nocardia fluminea]|uniref:class I SAM-dependent methyltransferase n=1 Tax=Nocardia fluminea TaxID=134984 RepID=UPI0036698899